MFMPQKLEDDLFYFLDFRWKTICQKSQEVWCKTQVTCSETKLRDLWQEFGITTKKIIPFELYFSFLHISLSKYINLKIITVVEQGPY